MFVDSELPATKILEDSLHDDSTLLVAPPRIGLGYTLKHYPVWWSFVPENMRTFDLMRQHFEIGTIVINAETPRLPLAELLEAGYGITRRFETRLGTWLILKPRIETRPSAPGDA